jgi:chemotaxis protein methyltransferase CheR
MTIKQFLGAYPGIELKFLASDIDTAVLGRAASGIYSYEDLKSLPAFLRTKWVKELENGRGQMTAAIRDSIRFARFNLQTERWPFQHPFDVIFCRNVLIYFDRETCLRIVEQMVQSLAPGGFLFLGHSESGMLRNDELQLIGNAVAQKRIR